VPRRKDAADKPKAERDEKGRIKKGSGSALAKRRSPEPPLSFTEFQRRIMFNEPDFEELWGLLKDRIRKYPNEPAYMKMWLDRVAKTAKDNEITLNVQPLKVVMPDGFTDEDVYIEAPRKRVVNEAESRR